MRSVLWFLVLSLCGASSSSRAAETVGEAFPPPDGASRVPPGPFATWLQARSVAAAETPVRTHDGRIVAHAARVVDLDMVSGDLQQCADSLIRLRAEWLRSVGKPVSFHATSGDPLPWSRVAGGERPFVSEDRIHWKPGGGSWERYLAWVFTWAGTASLDAYETQPATTPKPGDLLVDPGFPGHAVQLLDVARQGNRTFVLIGEGFMPAQSFHIELGPHDGWWTWDEGLALPHWRFDAGHLKRWR